MAILSSSEGKFYNVPDEELEQFLIPADEVKEKLSAAGFGSEGAPEGKSGEVSPYGCPPFGYWRNWRNCWRRNCWRNCW